MAGLTIKLIETIYMRYIQVFLQPKSLSWNQRAHVRLTRLTRGHIRHIILTFSLTNSCWFGIFSFRLLISDQSVICAELALPRITHAFIKARKHVKRLAKDLVGLGYLTINLRRRKSAEKSFISSLLSKKSV